MASAYQGDEANVTGRTVATVSGWNGTSPVRLTTTAPHGYSSGDWIYTANIGMPSIAGQFFKINRISSVVIELIGSTNDGTPTGSGAGIFDNSLTPSLPIPDDGDDLSAASVIGALKGLADRTQYLAGAPKSIYTSTATGETPITTTIGLPSDTVTFLALKALVDNDAHIANHLADLESFRSTDEASIAANAAAITHITPAYVLASIARSSGTNLGLSVNSVALGGPSGQSIALLSFPAVNADVVELDFHGLIDVFLQGAAASAVAVTVEVSQGGGGYASVQGMIGGYGDPISHSSVQETQDSLAIHGSYVVTTGGTQLVRVTFAGGGSLAASDTVQSAHAWNAFAKVYRAP